MLVFSNIYIYILIIICRMCRRLAVRERPRGERETRARSRREKGEKKEKRMEKKGEGSRYVAGRGSNERHLIFHRGESSHRDHFELATFVLLRCPRAGKRRKRGKSLAASLRLFFFYWIKFLLIIEYKFSFLFFY